LATVEKLNPKAQQLLSNTREELFLSAAGTWEISIKCAIGHLRLRNRPWNVFLGGSVSGGFDLWRSLTSMRSRSAIYRYIIRILSTACSSPKLGWNEWCY